jgi:hypothetical protein
MDERNLPNFFIIGATKCGTTSLYRHLIKHNDIFLPINKEPQFFCNDYLFSKGLSYYSCTHYLGSESFKAIGDSTPHYIYFKKVAERINACIDPNDQRFILILRDPVLRTYSLYWNMIYEGYESLTFREAINAEESRLNKNHTNTFGNIRFQYKDSSLYAKQIRRFKKICPNASWHFILLEELNSNPIETLNKVFDFLKIDRANIATDKISNKSSMPRSILLQNWLNRNSNTRHFFGRFLPHTLKYKIIDTIKNLNKKKFAYPSIDSDMEKFLREYFIDDILDLETIISKDLSHWKIKNSQ